MSKKIHFIGIAGVAIAPIALMMKELGWIVTGSDEDVFEPIKSFLINNGLPWQEGFSAERVNDADLVMVGGAAMLKHPDNVELAQAKALNKKCVNYGYLLQEFVIKNKSIVVAGTYGKTTTSGLISWLLDQAGLNPSFMTGGQPLNFSSGVRKTDSDYSVMEGDEFAAAWGFDMEPRFIYYKPKFTLIAAAQWDHLNLYPTEESFVDAFRKLLNKTVENKGLALLCSSGKNNDVLYKSYYKKLPLFSYGLAGYSTDGNDMKFKADTHYQSHLLDIVDKEFTHFELFKNDVKLGDFKTRMIGLHNVENATGALAMCDLLGLDVTKLATALSEYKFIKRRQEIRGKTAKGAIVMDDLAHSAVKVKATLEALRTRYKTENITVVFDPHSSSLSDRRSLDWYPGAFDLANEVIIPKVSVKKSTPKENRVYGADIANAIKATQANVSYNPIDTNIIDILKSKDVNTVIVFMSSGGWRGIIEDIISES